MPRDNRDCIGISASPGAKSMPVIEHNRLIGYDMNHKNRFHNKSPPEIPIYQSDSIIRAMVLQ